MAEKVVQNLCMDKKKNWHVQYLANARQIGKNEFDTIK